MTTDKEFEKALGTKLEIELIEERRRAAENVIVEKSDKENEN